MRLDDLRRRVAGLGSLPGVGFIRDAGPGDRRFDALLVAGPLLIASVVFVGRTPLTVGLAVAYLLSFLGATVVAAGRTLEATGQAESRRT
ncbi:MAG: hypothetical protein ABEI31_06905 [Halodesulfurarchaeum sp.]